MTENESKLIRTVHPTSVTLKPGNEPAVQPIYSSVKYTFESYGADDLSGVFKEIRCGRGGGEYH